MAYILYSLRLAAFGEVYHFLGRPQPAKTDHLEFARSFWRLTAALLKENRLRLDPLVLRRDGGLDGISRGLEELRAGHVSAGKLVFTLNEEAS